MIENYFDQFLIAIVESFHSWLESRVISINKKIDERGIIKDNIVLAKKEIKLSIAILFMSINYHIL